jgi:hypothetical protein
MVEVANKPPPYYFKYYPTLLIIMSYDFEKEKKIKELGIKLASGIKGDEYKETLMELTELKKSLV